MFITVNQPTDTHQSNSICLFRFVFALIHPCLCTSARPAAAKTLQDRRWRETPERSQVALSLLTLQIQQEGAGGVSLLPREKLAVPAAAPPPGPQAPVISANSQTASHSGSSTNTTLQAFYTVLHHILLSHSSPSISSIGWWDFHL